ncbi:pyruvate carboxylase [Gordonia phthalatica]|uniref:Pyruvate carboxylase n=1 Tax=Gordonia phthalatica TaxID=1136941 RepID=A0A0N9NF57_9ACTN|nr:pyruvate carboxylase [Gordonia phthalatica]ALG84256.1 pyruvate carboxylase [Gordonia phthalatica]
MSGVAKILVANRGEIAVRAFRAARDLGIGTVAVYPHEDRGSIHRFKADESYQIGTPGHPVKAYLSVEEMIGAALRSGADAVYPGYGFLSENAGLARACAENGVTFIGPAASVLDLTGDKKRSVQAAREAGLPVLAGSAPSSDPDELVEAAANMTFPVFVKAIAGGGGRGMRRVERIGDLADAVTSASREAQTAFGDPTVFLEQAVVEPRHIEVQILADTHGDVVHLYERDCSLQRRHQKVVEIAPAVGLDSAVRERICRDAVAFAQQIGYACAGTVEFLLDQRGQHFFIEMNPRIQVEHTVTEEVVDVDLVSAQLQIAGGASLADLGLSQETITVHGAAMQCRITTEDPADGFRPQTGRVRDYRAPGGAGVRLDGAAALGSEVTGHFDSMLVKLTCRGRDFPTAAARARRALGEFSIRGVTTNIGFLRAVLENEEFLAGGTTTSFIQTHPELLDGHIQGDDVGKLLHYLADVTVNRPHGDAPTSVRPTSKLPAVPTSRLARPPAGSRQQLLELGPEGFARALRNQKAVAITDTTFRDAHQSLLATRLRTSALDAVSRHVAALTPQLWSVECWGGATYDVALRFLREDPWQRLEKLREGMPNICLQMLLRGANTVGYTPYPDDVCRGFVAEAAATGVDVFRIFDALNSVDAMRPAIDAVRETGTAVAQVAMSYSGDLSDPREDLYTLDYYLSLAQRIVDAGAHVLAIKDMAGLLRPRAATALVGALRREFDLPIHVHTHDTAGGQVATYLAAIAAGADAVDAASAPLSGTTSQPSLSAVVAALENGEQDTGLDLGAVCSLEPYWEAVRRVYAPFESGVGAATGRVYEHEIPGGQLSNLRQQAISLGVGHRFEEVEQAYADADRLLGRPIKVTPSSKVVGDLALSLVAQQISAEDFAADPSAHDVPDSVIGFLSGDLGVPAAGWPEPLRTKVLGGRSRTAPSADLAAEDQAVLRRPGPQRRRALDRLLFPGPAEDFTDHRARFGDTSRLSATEFFYGLRPGEEHRVRLGPGSEMLVGIEAVGEPDDLGRRTVLFTVNGTLRPVLVEDRSVEPSTVVAERADRGDPRQIGAPFAGVVTVTVSEGDSVPAGATIGTIEAMKMEASITAPIGGVVKRVAVGGVTEVAPGDLLVEIG